MERERERERHQLAMSSARREAVAVLRPWGLQTEHEEV